MSEPAEKPEEKETVSAERKMLIVDIYYGASKDPVTEGFSAEEWSPNDKLEDVVRRALDKEEKRDKAQRVIKAIEKGNPMVYEGTNPKYRSKQLQPRDVIGKYLVEQEHQGTKFQNLSIRVPEPQEGGVPVELPTIGIDEVRLRNWERTIKKYAKPGDVSGSAAESLYG